MVAAITVVNGVICLMHFVTRVALDIFRVSFRWLLVRVNVIALGILKSCAICGKRNKICIGSVTTKAEFFREPESFNGSSIEVGILMYIL